MMMQQQKQPALLDRVPRYDAAQQWRPAKVEPKPPRVEARAQLPGSVSCSRIEHNLLHRQERLPPDHLHGLRQPFPDHRRAQDVMPVNHLLNRAQKAIEQRARVERQQPRQHVRIPFRSHQMMKKNTFLQWSQRINVLHIGRSPRHTADDVINVILLQLNQRQHLRRDRLALRRTVADSAASVGVMNSERTSTWNPWRRMRSITVSARSECPPSSKKLSCTPTRSSRRTSHQIAASASSVALRGAT